MKLAQRKTAALGLAVTACTALALTACSGNSSSSSSASATTSASATSASPTTTTSPSVSPTSTATGAKLSTSSYFEIQGAKTAVTSGTIDGLVANPSTVKSSGQTASGSYNFSFTVNSKGKVTSATLTIGKDTYKSIGTSGSVEFGDAHPGAAVGTTTAIAVTKNGGNGSLALNFDLVTVG